MRNIGFFGGRIKCVEEILRILAALGRLRGYEPGQVGDLACQEVSGHFDMHFAGNGCKMCPQCCSYRDRIIHR